MICSAVVLLVTSFYSQDLMQASTQLEMKASSQFRWFPLYSKTVPLRGAELAASTSMTSLMISAWAIELVSCVGSAHRTRGWTSLSLAVGNAMKWTQCYSQSSVSINSVLSLPLSSPTLSFSFTSHSITCTDMRHDKHCTLILKKSKAVLCHNTISS